MLPCITCIKVQVTFVGVLSYAICILLHLDAYCCLFPVPLAIICRQIWQIVEERDELRPIFMAHIKLTVWKQHVHPMYDWSLLDWFVVVQRHTQQYFIYIFLARQDGCPESYCRTPSVGVGVRVHVHKHFNLANNSWTTIDRPIIFHMCIPCDPTFPWVPKCLT